MQTIYRQPSHSFKGFRSTKTLKTIRCSATPTRLGQIRVSSGAHNPERATPIQGLCHTVYTDQFIFRHILGHFFQQKQNLHHVYESIRSIRYQKGKLNVIKRKKLFYGLQVFLTGFQNLKDIQNSCQKRFENKLVLQNAVT